MKKEALATGGAIGLSILIASCCIAPTLFLVFGVSIGMLGALSSLAPYQPYFVGAGVLALGFAGHQIFRSADIDTNCEDGTCAPDSGSRRFTRRLFFVAIAFFAASIAYPYFLNTVL